MFSKCKKRENVSLLKYLLSNNIPCYMIEHHERKVTIEFYLVVNIGSKNDPPNKKGVAHYLEHMLLNFDGDQEEKDRAISNIWGCTNFEETVFHITCLNEYKVIKKAIDLMQKIILGKLLNPRIIEKVRKDIVSEWCFQVDYDQWQARQREEIKNKVEEYTDENWEVDVSEYYFKQRNTIFPYMKGLFNIQEDFPVGKLEDINAITFEDIQAFHKAYYNVSAMNIIAIGDLRKNNILELLNRDIGELKVMPNEDSTKQLRRFNSTKQNYLFEVHNKEKQFKVFIYLLKECQSMSMSISLYQSFMEKILLFTLGQYLETKLIEKKYKVSNSEIDSMWLMEKNKLYTVEIDFEEFKQVELLEKHIIELIKDFKLSSLRQYHRRCLKRMMLEYLDANMTSLLIDQCIGECVYNEHIKESPWFYKMMKQTCENLNKNKVNELTQRLIKDSSLYIYCNIGDGQVEALTVKLLNGFN